MCKNLGGSKPRVPVYNTLIQYFQTTKDRAKALQYYSKMVQARVPPSAHTYRLLIDSYGAIEPIDPASAEEVFRQLEKDFKVGVQGIHWASLISMWGVHLHNFDRAMAVFESISHHPSSRRTDTPLPDSAVYEAVFNVLTAHNRTDLYETFLNRMQSSGVHLVTYIGNTLIKVITFFQKFLEYF